MLNLLLRLCSVSCSLFVTFKMRRTGSIPNRMGMWDVRNRFLGIYPTLCLKNSLYKTTRNKEDCNIFQDTKNHVSQLCLPGSQNYVLLLNFPVVIGYDSDMNIYQIIFFVGENDVLFVAFMVIWNEHLAVFFFSFFFQFWLWVHFYLSQEPWCFFTSFDTNVYKIYI